MNNLIMARIDSPYGGMSPIWEMDHRRISAFIRDHKLEPVTERRLPIPRPFPGGWKIAHVHFEGEVFMLDQDQWKEFAHAQLDTFRERLNNMETVSFNNLMQIGEAIDMVGPIHGAR